MQTPNRRMGTARGVWKNKWKMVVMVLLVFSLAVSASNTLVDAQQAGMGQSYGALLQGITPEQREMLKKLTPEQRQSLKAEVIANGGVLTPALIDKLKAQVEAMTQQNPGAGGMQAAGQAAIASGQSTTVQTTLSDQTTQTTPTVTPGTETPEEAGQNISAA
jgi:hypothetical protein